MRDEMDFRGEAGFGAADGQPEAADKAMRDAVSEVFDVRLVEVSYAARDINLYSFARPDGATLPPVEPGAHVDLILPNGVMRQYSLVHPGRSADRYTIGVKRDAAGAGGSVFLHDRVPVGSLLKLSHPRNHFPLYEDAPHSVLIAGGIGITPIYAMAERLHRLGRGWEMHYSSRSRDDAAFQRELATLGNVGFHFDAESVGVFLDLAGIVAAAPEDAHFYCCGPLPMLAAFEAATAGVPAERVHVEYFTAKDAPASEGGFTVELVRSGSSYPIPAGKTILDVLRDAGLDVPASCEKGVCGTCETRVIAGTPDHRDAILTESEKRAGDTMMICCSGAKSDRLVLDL
jgi:ferredoxin-NADP reductase